MESVSLPNKDVTVAQQVIYATPTSLTWFLGAPILFVLPGMYAKHFGLALTSIATVILISRLFDAITDPIIGYISDKLRQRTGTRKVIIAAGVVCLLVGSYLLFVPLVEVTATYYLLSHLVFYMGWTLFEVPHLAWGGELARDYQSKTRLYKIRWLFASSGVLLFYSIPLMGIFKSTEFTLDMLEWSVILCAILAVPTLILCIKMVPNGYAIEASKRDSFRSLASSILRNSPLLIFLAAFMVLSIGMGMWVGTTFIYIDAYLGLGESMALVLAVMTLTSIISIEVWSRIAIRYGKKWAWGLGMIVGAAGLASLGFLESGGNAIFHLMISMSAVYCSFACTQTIAPSVLSDIVDYSTLKFGNNRGGAFFSVYLIVTKASMSVGTALSLAIAGWYQMDPTETSHSEQSLFGLFLSISYIPALLLLLSIALINHLPIDVRRHEIIRRRLDSLNDRRCE